MKNILLKTILVFVVMTIFNTGFVDETVKFLKLPGGDFGMLSTAILIGCMIVCIVGLITVFIFKHQLSFHMENRSFIRGSLSSYAYIIRD